MTRGLDKHSIKCPSEEGGVVKIHTPTGNSPEVITMLKTAWATQMPAKRPKTSAEGKNGDPCFMLLKSAEKDLVSARYTK